MKKAKYIRTTRDDGEIVQKLYELDPPLEEFSFLSEERESHQYVIVSAANHGEGILRVHETYIFPADKDGEITDWGELPGSIKGTTDHEEALQEAGYEVVE